MKKSGYTPYIFSGYKTVEDYLNNVIWNNDNNNIFKLMYNQINCDGRNFLKFIIDNDIVVSSVINCAKSKYVG